MVWSQSDMDTCGGKEINGKYAYYTTGEKIVLKIVLIELVKLIFPTFSSATEAKRIERQVLGWHSIRRAIAVFMAHRAILRQVDRLREEIDRPQTPRPNGFRRCRIVILPE